MALYEYRGVAPRVHASAYVHPSASIIGDVIVGAGCYIGPGASLRGDFGAIRVGEDSNVQDNCTLHVGHGMTCLLGERSHVGHGAVVHGARLERNALIGMNAIVMDDAIVGDSAIVAACAFVKSGMEVPARALVMGVPARIVRVLTDAELREKVEATNRYCKLAASSLATIRRIDMPICG
ncbi:MULTISPECIES: gamma carbonic anhydrase family protein [Burkholderia]|uniref:gamma carbonic anhydrase family protein n=1 Tax=Burkholderia TaxID=32008 RepID=UPI0010A5E302|nr:MULTISPECIES: phenylacetic acid degradation protein PaaY [Burkholderia]MEB2500073.1 phenylacetic acid degradation protein PaaY [Burkholderia cenocepacia]MEB2557638.1 phenylacetic acid degradation protein PaaY [Burkholderia cenocepacia]THJ48363.1 phenylacetic acid degradation protein PaaY [Burkholderia sp. LS-044]